MQREEVYARLPGALLPWYAMSARDLPWRRDREPYHVWLSEIMLQQTRVEAARGYYLRFLEAFPVLSDLAAADEARLMKLWEGLGYYSRARNLQKTARLICDSYGGSFPTAREELEKLPGVGPYTAGAVASICFEQPCAAVDGNVLRVLSRLTADDAPIDLPATRAEMAKRLESVYPAGACGDFTQALMELGAVVCTPKSPKCGLCPARSFCTAAENGETARYPVRLPKREKRVEARTVLLLECDGRFAVERRGPTGLLAGLWQLPNLSGARSADEAMDEAAALGTQPAQLCRELHRTHIFTHIRWDMVCYRIRCRFAPPRFVWATPGELRETYALPTAFRIFLEGEV